MPSNPSAPQKRRNGRILLRLIIYLSVVYVVWCGLLYFYQDRLLFPADMAPQTLPLKFVYDKRTEVIQFDLEAGGRVVAWFIPAPGASDTKPAPVVIFFHGNAEIIDFLDEIVTPYRQLGISVFLPEYRGYGRSAGKPTETALVEDAARFYDEMVQRPDVDKARIVIHGRSLGGGPATALAARRPAQALILQSAFTSAADLANRYFAPGFIVRNSFHNDRILPNLNIPVLIAHGTEDEIVPVKHGRSLAKLARNVVYLEYPCKHNGFPGVGNDERYWNEIAAFLRKSGVLRDGPP